MAHCQIPRFCPDCGGPLLTPLEATGPTLICSRCGQGHYLDPKVAVAAVVELDGGVVLLRRAQRDQAHGLWILPGGHVDRGEEVILAGRREVLEETGLEVDLPRLLGVYSYQDNPTVLVVYLAQVLGGSLRRTREALEIDVFPPGRIPWDRLGFSSTGDALRDYLALT